MNSRRTPSYAVVAAACLLVSGCCERIDQGGVTVYRFAWSDGLLLTAGGILGATIGWYALRMGRGPGLLRMMVRRLGCLLLILGVVPASLIGPSRFTDRVAIDDAHFEATYGFWLRPTHRSVRFDEVLAMRLANVPQPRGGVSRQLQCRLKDGGLAVVPLGDLFGQAVYEVLERARARGVAVGPGV